MNKKNLLVKIHGYVCSDGCIDFWKSKDLHGKKIRTRLRLRIRFYSADKELIEDFIHSLKICFPNLKNIRYYPKRYEVEVRNHPSSKEILKLGKVTSREWEFPANLTQNQKILWIRAFVDCDGTVQNANYDRFIAIDSINFNGLNKIKEELALLGISSNLYSIFCGKSFRLKIFRKENILKYNDLIGFTHEGKQRKLDEAIKSYKKL